MSEFALEEAACEDILAGIGRYTLCANDPPWSAIAARMSPPVRVINARDMNLSHLEKLLEDEPDSEAVVGLGGGSALDTAKFIAWKSGKRLIQIPSIVSVDAAFTDAIGVRINRTVKYIGRVVPSLVVLDVDLVRGAPARLNRSGIGDILSCHTALWDWRHAVDRQQGVPWDTQAAALGAQLLYELDGMVDDVQQVTAVAVRWLASAYRRIGAECARLRHSRFEEGSEHFLGYAFEHVSDTHPLHGELIALCVVAMSELQGNDPLAVRERIRRSGIRCNPTDVGMTATAFVASMQDLRGYCVREGLDFSVANTVVIDEHVIARLWQVIEAL
jgi:glycerol dehydrogenase-like iron-containing ADH family enzyme